MSRRKISRRESLALLGTSVASAASGMNTDGRQRGGSESASSGRKFEIVREGRANAVIVVEENSGGLNLLAAKELQKYVGELTGVHLEIISPGGVSKEPKEEVLLLVGGPQSNSIVKRSTDSRQVDFGGLKPEGFIIRTVEVEGNPGVVMGGNDEGGTLYAVYEWLGRQGVVFQISGDIIPEHKRSLGGEVLDVRMEPAFRQRGFGIASCYETRSIWSYPDIVKFIDQMAKEKLNFLIWHMFSPEPYLEYSYRGEKKWMGDETPWEGGYTLPGLNFGSRKVGEWFVGKEAFEKFGKNYMAPDEWQGIKDQDQVYAAAQDLLQRVIRYAKMRNVKVWVALESPNELSPLMARHCPRVPPLPFSPFHSAYACPTDLALYEINSLRFKALLHSYPEAEGFIFWMDEGYPVCRHPEDKKLFESERPKYKDAKERLINTHIENYGSFDEAIDNCIGQVHLIQKILGVRDQISPKTRIGVGMWGRAFLLPTLDKVLPKDVLLIDNETSGVWTPKGVPMQFFGGMGERDRIFMHVGDDDTGMIGMQFHVRLYYKDGLLEGSAKNGCWGITELGDRFRGEEQLAAYMAEGAWNIQLTPDDFYHNYARRIFGERAEAPMFQAFMALEDKEGYEGYHGQKRYHIRLMACCSPPEELRIAKKYAEQPNPYDGPVFEEWKPFIEMIPHRINLFTREAKLEEMALEHMKAAEAVASPGSRYELRYLQNKTRAYAQMIRAFIRFDMGFAALDRAFQVNPRTQHEGFLRRMNDSLQEFQHARMLARNSARTWSEVIDNVSDLGVLWRLNTYVVAATELVENFVENINNFHLGKAYLKVVPWEKIFSPLPIIQYKAASSSPAKPS